MNSNLHLPPGMQPPQGGMVMGKLNFKLQRMPIDVVGGSAISLGIQQSGPSEATAMIVSVGGVSKLQYLAAQILGGNALTVEGAIDLAQELLARTEPQAEPTA